MKYCITQTKNELEKILFMHLGSHPCSYEEMAESLNKSLDAPRWTPERLSAFLSNHCKDLMFRRRCAKEDVRIEARRERLAKSRELRAKASDKAKIMALREKRKNA